MCGSSGPSAGEMRRMQEEERRRMEYEATMKKAKEEAKALAQKAFQAKKSSEVRQRRDVILSGLLSQDDSETLGGQS